MYRNYFIQLIFFSILIPISIYLFILVPFSSLIDLTLISNINFFVWGSVGLMLLSSLIMSIFIVYLESGRLLIKDYFASIFVSKITIIDIVLSLIVWVTAISFVQFLFSMLIAKALVPEFYITLKDFFLFIFLALCTCSFFSSFFIMLYIVLDRSYYSKIIATIFFILFFSFGSGLFIPASEKYYTLEYIALLSKTPLSLMIGNFQNIVLNKNIIFFNVIVLLFSSIVSAVVTIYFVKKRSID